MGKLMEERIYPAYWTYSGKAYKGNVEWHSLTILDIKWFVEDAVEREIRNKGGEPLYIRVYDEGDIIEPIHGLVHRYSMEFAYYCPNEAYYLFPWEAVIFAILAIIAIIAIWYALREVKEIIWGPGGERTITPVSIALMGLGIGIAGFGIGYMISKARGEGKVERRG